jgi:DNA-binding transcriptional regulator WhiA
MNYQSILDECIEWRKDRTSASLWITCDNREQALDVQSVLKNFNFRAFVTTVGKKISIVLYLNDHQTS